MTINFIFVRTEIPLFHILNASVTFGNLNGKKEPVPGVTNVVVEDLGNQEMTGQPVPVPRPELPAELPVDNETTTEDQGEEEEKREELEPATICDVDPSVFDVPSGYGHYRAGQVSQVVFEGGQ